MRQWQSIFGALLTLVGFGVIGFGLTDWTARPQRTLNPVSHDFDQYIGDPPEAFGLPRAPGSPFADPLASGSPGAVPTPTGSVPTGSVPGGSTAGSTLVGAASAGPTRPAPIRSAPGGSASAGSPARPTPAPTGSTPASPSGSLSGSPSAVGSPSAGPQASGVTVAADAPLMALRGRTLDGAPFDAKALAGRPVVVWFWSPWCEICRLFAPDVHAAAGRYAGRAAFVGVGGLDPAPAALRAFVQETGATGLPHLADNSGALYRHFGVTAQNTWVILRTDGTVAYQDIVDVRDMTVELDKIVG
ncbi:MAG TPA: redoxin domain-containing protein [Micromonosporaceae bacterium]|nr:redoxin domain-containing protein [Micromonosporaceae bacterium]